jgi:hypothetical protein
MYPAKSASLNVWGGNKVWVNNKQMSAMNRVRFNCKQKTE